MFWRRILGVFGLNAAVFSEIEHDRGATGQAAAVVAIVAIVSALGNAIAALFGDANALVVFLSALFWAFAGWILWSLSTYFVGTLLFGGQADLNEMLRVIGFAFAPQVLGIIPCIGTLVGAIWSLVAGFVAVREGLDLDTLKTLLTILVGFVVYVIGWIVVGFITSGITNLFS